MGAHAFDTAKLNAKARGSRARGREWTEEEEEEENDMCGRAGRGQRTEASFWLEKRRIMSISLESDESPSIVDTRSRRVL